MRKDVVIEIIANTVLEIVQVLVEEAKKRK